MTAAPPRPLTEAYLAAVGLAKRTSIALARDRGYAVGADAALESMLPLDVGAAALARALQRGVTLGAELSARYMRSDGDEAGAPCLEMRFLDRCWEAGKHRMTSLDQLAAALEAAGVEGLLPPSSARAKATAAAAAKAAAAAAGHAATASKKRKRRADSDDDEQDAAVEEEEAAAVADRDTEAAAAPPPAPPLPAMEIVLVASERLSAEASKRLTAALCTSRARALRVQVLLQGQLLARTPSHPQVPTHRALRSAAAATYLRGHDVDATQLVQLRHDSDPIASWYNWPTGTVVQFERPTLVTRVVV